MTKTLQNSFYEIEIDQETGSWSMNSQWLEGLRFEGATFGLSVEQGLRAFEWNGPLDQPVLELTKGVDEIHGRWRGLLLEGSPSAIPLHVRVDFRLLFEWPLLIWQVHLRNSSDQVINLKRLDLLRIGDPPRHWLKDWLSRRGAGDPDGRSFAGLKPDAWFMDGWQSWSFAGTLGRDSIVTGTRLGPLTRPMYLNPTSSQGKGSNHYISEFFGVLSNQASGMGILFGQLSEHKAFASLRTRMNRTSTYLRLSNALEGMSLAPGEGFVSDWAGVQMLDLSQSEPHREYLEAVGRENHVGQAGSPPVGWSSWYYFFDHVKESDVRRNVEWLGQQKPLLPLQIIQLDDGYQAEIGDWLELNDRFPKGHRELVRRIEADGFTPGLWLAPFIAKPSAHIVRSHPDWILRQSNGRPVRAGFNWGSFIVALDLTHPEVLDYVHEVVRTAVQTWGYRYLKLDFLYAAALEGNRRDPNQTGARTLRNALEVIRAAAGENVFLAGCGCPLGPAVGLMDSMRIGPDVAPRWLPAYQGIEAFFRQEPSLPSLRNAIQNSLTRAALHRRWWLNDPDCVLIRSIDSHLSADEVKLMATVAALSGGSLFLSDDMPRLMEEREQWAARLLPPLETNARVPDLFRKLRPETMILPLQGVVGEWILLALINWSGTSRRMDYDVDDKLTVGQDVIGVDFWREEPVCLKGKRWSFEVPGHGVRLMQLRRNVPGTGTWLGDNLHISGGSMIKGWQLEQTGLQAELVLGRLGSGKAWLRLPAEPMEARLNGNPLELEMIGDRITMIRLPEFERGTLVVRWQ